MSALPPIATAKADMCSAKRHVRFTPNSDIDRHISKGDWPTDGSEIGGPHAFHRCAPELLVFVRARFDAVICSLRVHDLIRVILRSACDLLDGAKLVGARWKRIRNVFVGSHFLVISF